MAFIEILKEEREGLAALLGDRTLDPARRVDTALGPGGWEACPGRYPLPSPKGKEGGG